MAAEVAAEEAAPMDANATSTVDYVVDTTPEEGAGVNEAAASMDTTSAATADGTQAAAAVGTAGDMSPYVVRLRGLPWGTTDENVMEFFASEVVPKGMRTVEGTVCARCVTLGRRGVCTAVRQVLAPGGRPSGEAFVELHSEEDLNKAKGTSPPCHTHSL